MVEHRMDIDVPGSWEEAAREAARSAGAVMIIGATDAGKSTLARYLIDYLIRAGRKVALVDCDVGQTTLGPPAAISMARVEEAGFYRGDPRPEKMRFVGAVSPAGHILEAVLGAAAMVQRAGESGVELTVVDTDGMVQGVSAVRLKYNQVALIDPAMVLALQKGTEIEPLLASLSSITGDRLLRLPASASVQTKTFSQKRNHRRLRFLSYFSTARVVSLSLGSVAIQGTPLGMGRKLPGEEIEFISRELSAPVLHAEKEDDSLFLVVQRRVQGERWEVVCDRYGVNEVRCAPLSDYFNRLVGLCESSGDCLALGTVKGINFASKTMDVWTPLGGDAVREVKLVQFGSVKVEPSGEERWIR